MSGPAGAVGSVLGGLGTVIGAITGLAGAPKPPTLPPVPTPTNQAAIDAANATRYAAAQAAGRASTIATSGLGDTAAATTGKTTLLGVR